MNYFGTDLRSAGHYFWSLEGDSIGRSGIYFKDIPFDPETLLVSRTKGEVEFFNIEGYSICAIVGSCTDKRHGTKSVFWLKEKLTDLELIERIKSIPIAMKIINQMPFQVQYLK